MQFILVFFMVVSIPGCTNFESRPDKSHSSSISDYAKDSFVISPVYPDTVFFIVNSVSSDSMFVTGDTTNFKNLYQVNYETYFQRFVEKRKDFRIIHATGTGIEVKEKNNKQSTKKYSFNDTISFDEKGIFENDTTDPVSLIPLYPNHPVKLNEQWQPKAPVKISMGTGTAEYNFKIDSVYKDVHNSQLALIKVNVTALLQPISSLKGGKVTVLGGGWFVWDCTINQRRETHLKVIYTGKKDKTVIRQTIMVDDELKVYKVKQSF